MLNKNKIYKYSNKNLDFNSIYVFDTIDSTNTYCKTLIQSTPSDYMLVVSNHQTAGRGRLGRSFYSPKESGIYLSFAYKCNDIESSIAITTKASIAVYNAIKKFSDKNIFIKWVNDLYIDDKKFCGILTEATTSIIDNNHYIIIGIGINCNTSIFPSELETIATSLDINISRNDLISNIINELIYYIENPNDNSYLIPYKERSYVLGKEIYYFINDEKHIGTVTNINDQCELIIDGKTILRNGDISIRLNKN